MKATGVQPEPKSETDTFPEKVRASPAKLLSSIYELASIYKTAVCSVAS